MVVSSGWLTNLAIMRVGLMVESLVMSLAVMMVEKTTKDPHWVLTTMMVLD